MGKTEEKAGKEDSGPFKRMQDWGLINEQQKSTLQSAAGLLGDLATSVGYVNTAIGVASFIGEKLGWLNPGPSPMELLSSQINDLKQAMLNQFKEVLQTSKDNFEIAWQRDIAEQEGIFLGALTTLKQYPPESRDHLTKTADVPRTVFTALNTIEQPAFWQRTHYPQTDFDLPWDPKPQPLEGNRVFDYRYTLPVYLRSIITYVAVIGICNKESYLILNTGIENILDPEWKVNKQVAQSIKDDIETRINFLRDKHNKIRDAIEDIRRPTVQELRYKEVETSRQGDKEDPRPQNPRLVYYAGIPLWYENDRLYGVVEKYTSSCSIDRYPESEFPAAPTPLDGRTTVKEPFSHWYFPKMDRFYVDSKFKAKHAVKTLKHWKKLYNELGLAEVWKTLNYLKVIIRERPEEVNGRDGNWSLREVDRVVGMALYEEPTTAPQGEPISVRKLASLLDVSPPTSLRQMFER